MTSSQPPTNMKASLEELSRQTLNKSEHEITGLIKEFQKDRFPFRDLPVDSELVEPGKEWRDALSGDLAELGNLPQIIPETVRSGPKSKTLIVVPTQNADKIKLGEKFAKTIAERWFGSSKDASNNNYQIIGRNGDSRAGNQPYTHEQGMKGACRRIINAHAKLRKEFDERPKESEIDFDNIYDILFLSFENHIVFRKFQSSQDPEKADAHDFPAIMLWNDRGRNASYGIGPGVRVPPYYLCIARSCHYENIPGTEIEDKSKGLVTVGKVIELLSGKTINGANWHHAVCGRDRYDIILEALVQLYEQRIKE